MKTNFLRLPEVISRTGLSRSTIYKFINEKKFPPPIKIGLRSVAWLDRDIEQWQETKIQLHKTLNNRGNTNE